MFKYNKPNIVCTCMAWKCWTRISFTARSFKTGLYLTLSHLWPWQHMGSAIRMRGEKISNIWQVSDYCHRWLVVSTAMGWGGGGGGGVRNVVNQIWHRGGFFCSFHREVAQAACLHACVQSCAPFLHLSEEPQPAPGDFHGQHFSLLPELHLSSPCQGKW